MAQIVVVDSNIRNNGSEAFNLLSKVTAVPILRIEMWLISPNQKEKFAQMIDEFILAKPDGIVLVLT